MAHAVIVCASSKTKKISYNAVCRPLHKAQGAKGHGMVKFQMTRQDNMIHTTYITGNSLQYRYMYLASVCGNR